MPKTVVYGTLIRRLDRKFPTGEKSIDFQAQFVAKLSATNCVAKKPYFTSIGTPMGRLLGYARVSTAGQDAQLHLHALTKAGCYRIFTDTAAGSLESRPELDRLLD